MINFAPLKNQFDGHPCLALVREPINITQLEQVYRDNFTRLCYYALDLVGDMDTAQDVVNDAAYGIWQRRDSVYGDKLEGLLFVTVRNNCMNVLRRRKTRQEHADEVARLHDQIEDLDALREQEQRLAEVQEVIGQLPPRTRYVLEQCYLHDRSYKEVAAVLEITTDGVKHHITKALKVLREHFQVQAKKSSTSSTQKLMLLVLITILTQLMSAIEQ